MCQNIVVIIRYTEEVFSFYSQKRFDGCSTDVCYSDVCSCSSAKTLSNCVTAFFMSSCSLSKKYILDHQNDALYFLIREFSVLSRMMSCMTTFLWTFEFSEDDIRWWKSQLSPTSHAFVHQITHRVIITVFIKQAKHDLTQQVYSNIITSKQEKLIY